MANHTSPEEQQEIVAYVRDLTTELATMARSAQFHALAHALDVAGEEARKTAEQLKGRSKKLAYRITEGTA